MVELKNVSVTYSSGVDALNNVSLKINDGDFAFVVGSSGAGKSTMIKLLLKEIDATSGVITVNGYNLSKLKRRKVPEFRRTLGFVFQDFRLIPSMTVYENIAFVLRVIDAPIKYIRKRVPYVISLVGLQAKSNSYPDELSGGEKQRVAIARALVNDPELIIADEPTGNIDPELSYEIVELLKSINDQGTTILMVTHEHDLVKHFGGRIISITDGEIVYDEVILGEKEEQLAEEYSMDEEFAPDEEYPMYEHEQYMSEAVNIGADEQDDQVITDYDAASPNMYILDDEGSADPDAIIAAITEEKTADADLAAQESEFVENPENSEAEVAPEKVYSEIGGAE